MKKIIIALVVLFAFFGCNKFRTPEQNLLANAEEELKKHMNDPSSYEFVSFQVDTMDTQFARERLIDLQKDISKYNNNAVINMIQNDINQLKAQYNFNDKSKVKYKLEYRGKNSFGALILSRVYVVATNDDNLDFIEFKSVE